MTAEWSVPAWAVLATLVLLLVLGLVVVLAVRRFAARTESLLVEARGESRELREQVHAIEAQLHTSSSRSGTVAAEREYVITRLGEPPEERPDSVPAVDGALFADLVLRESVVQTASFVAGLRRALAPEHLNRIRFEMRREIKRARKQRRADLRQARREYEARARGEEAAA